MDKDAYHGHDKDAEIKRLNEKIEFLSRTNMLYSDWEHRETQVTSDLIRKGIEEAKINAELRAEIGRLQAVEWSVEWGKACEIPCVSIIKRLPDGGIEVIAVEYGPLQRQWVGMTHDEVPKQYKDDSVFVEGWLWAEAKLKDKNR